MSSIRDGSLIYLSMTTTDRGVAGGKGGSAGVLAAAYGAGKSTLMQQMAMISRWVDNRYTKKEYFADPYNVPLYLTTCLWFPGEHDHWNAFLPRYVKRTFPHEPTPKGFLLHHHEDDALTFWEVPDDGGQTRLTALTPDLISPYKDDRDLFSHIERNGLGKINVVYPPQRYILSERFLKKIKAMAALNRARRENKGGADRARVTQRYEADTGMAAYRKPGRPRERYVVPLEEVEVEPHVFYHEFIDHMLREKGSEHMAIFYDDVSHFLQAYQTDINFHLISIFAGQSFPAMRKSNTSFFAATHDLGLLDWKVLLRFRTFMWLPTSRVVRKVSRVWQSVVSTLPIGRAIIEDRETGFGWIPYSKIPHQPPVVLTKGLAL
jgi:hypothetical protein